MSSYILSSITMRQFERDWWLRKFKESGVINTQSQHFILHVWLCSRIQLWRMQEDGGIPVWWKTRENHLPKSRVETSILGYIPCWRQGGRVRAYFVRPEILLDLDCYTASLSSDEIIRSPKVDFFTGHKVRSNQNPTVWDENRNLIPEPLLKMSKALSKDFSYCNLSDIDAHINALNLDEEEAKAQYEALETEETYKEHLKAQGRRSNDTYCRAGVLDAGDHCDGDILYFSQRYHFVSTGRPFFNGGGLQQASTGMKAAAYTGINYTNIDLKSCHLFVFVQLYREAFGHEPKHLLQYLEEGGRKKFSDAAGLPEDVFKPSVLSLLNAAPRPVEVGERPSENYSNSIWERIKDAFKNEPQKIRAGAEGFNEVTRGIHHEFKQWHRYLKEDWLPANENHRGRGGIRTVKNAVGKTTPTKDIKLSYLTAFILQGYETRLMASFICNLVESGYRVLSHEFDGVVINAPISKDPEELRIAKNECGIDYAFLESKEFKAKIAA
jgi:hypothetical protein